MSLRNLDVAEILESHASLLEIDQASPFRIRAYRNAADTIRVLDPPLAAMVAEGKDLTEVQDVGKGIAKTIEEIVALGREAYLEKLDRETGPGLLELLRVPGLGPGRVRKIRDALGLTTLDELRAAAEQGKLRGIPGFGEKTEETILRRVLRHQGRKEASEPPSVGE